MNMNAKVIAISAQKGGVGKTATTINLGAALTQAGRKVLLIDCDIHASLTIRLGNQQPKLLNNTLGTMMEKCLRDNDFDMRDAIMHHEEGFDYIPSNTDLSGVELALAGVMSRETVLSDCLEGIKGEYEYILLDCLPSLGLIAINALAAADEVLMVTKADYDSAKGIEDLLFSIRNIRKRINPTLSISGILFTMVDLRTVDERETIGMLREMYGDSLRFFESMIPASVRAREPGKYGISIFEHDGKGSIAQAYGALAKEVDAA